ncbi:hypothetical protein GLGCALEP_02817 [Pseudomonas sp. MM221]|nr:hypothetical protein GLGCALEP_02817 [Pseudomonas sp. MM221]
MLHRCAPNLWLPGLAGAGLAWSVLAAVFDHFYLGAFTQAVGAFQHQPVAGLQAFEDDTVLAIAGANLELAHVHRVLGVDHIGKGTVIAKLDGCCRRHHHLLEGIGQQAHVDELVGEQGQVLVLEAALELEGTGGGVDLVVDAAQHAGGLQLAVTAVPGLDRQAGATAVAFQHSAQFGFRQGERNADRLGLGNHHQRGGVVGCHQVAQVELAQAHAAVDWRTNLGEVEVQAGIVDLCLVGLDQPLELRHLCFGGVEGLLGNTVFGVQAFVAGQVDLGVFQLRLVLRQGAFSLLKGDAVRARVDFSEQVAGLDLLAFLEVDFYQLASHAAAHIDRVGGGDRAQGLVVKREVAYPHRLDPYRHRVAGTAEARAAAHHAHALAAAPAAGFFMRRRCCRPQPPGQCSHQQQDQQADEPATGGTGIGRLHGLNEPCSEWRLGEGER